MMTPNGGTTNSGNDMSPASSLREMGTNGGWKATMRDRLSIDPLRNLRDVRHPFVKTNGTETCERPKNN